MGTAIVRFDSKCKDYKRPFGAVKSGTEVFFDVKIRTDYVVRRVSMCVLYDRHTAPAVYEMEHVRHDITLRRAPGIYISGGHMAAESSELYADYKAQVTFLETGLYWYWFEIETDLGYLKVGRSQDDDSPVMIDTAFSKEEPVPWQQTVYLREHKEPEWIYGGVYYHIFVDRFAKGRLSIFDESENESSREDSAAQTGAERTDECDNEKCDYEIKLRRFYEGLGKNLREDWGGMPSFRPNGEGKIINNDFFGGNLPGIIEKLPYLSELGVTCLYLSPIFEAYSNHKYDTADYLKIAPEFGTEKDFEKLCQMAGELGIRVILDGVFAHTGSDSVYFNKYRTYGSGGAWNDPYSPYRRWYMFHYDGSYDSWWGIDTLPKLNKEEPSYVGFITGNEGVARHWLKKGASGWRLDVADELPVSFMTALSDAVHEEKRDALLIGEVWEDASNKVAYDERKNYFEGDKLDSVMDYPLKDAIIRFVREGDAKALALTTERITENYPPFAVNSLMNSLGTHDSIRVLTALAGEKIEPCLETREEQAAHVLSGTEYEEGIQLMKAAVLLQMTLPGVPCIYYGDEAGMQGYSDPFNRVCYPWGNENKELLDWYRRLIRIRLDHDVYARGVYRTIVAEDGLYAFERAKNERSSGRRKDKTVTVVNRSDRNRRVALEGRWKDLLTGSEYRTAVPLKSGQMMLLISVY